MFSPQEPSLRRYLLASMVGALAGGILLAVLPPSSLMRLPYGGLGQPEPGMSFIVPATLWTVVLYIGFLVVGLPVFLIVRRTRWFRWSILTLGSGGTTFVALLAQFGTSMERLLNPWIYVLPISFGAATAVAVSACWVALTLKLKRADRSV